MFKRVVKASDVQERLVPTFYEPGRAALESQVRHLGLPCSSLGELVEEDTSITYGIVQPGTFVRPGTGVRLIRCVDIDGLTVPIDDVLWVSHEISRPYQRSEVKPNDVLIGIAGTLACIGLAPVGIEPANLNQSVARLRVGKRTGVLPHWVAAFLSSRFGQAILLRRSVGSVQQHLNLADLPDVPILLPDPQVRAYIGDKLRHAECLRERARKAITQARTMLEQIVAGQCDNVEMADAANSRPTWNTKDSQRHIRISPDAIIDRLDAWYHKPIFAAVDVALHRLCSQGINIASIKSISDVEYGFMPTEDYWPAGQGAHFLRTTNLGDDFTIDLSDVKYVNPTSSNDPGYRLRKGDVLVVQCGNYTGRVNLIPERLVGWVFPSFSLRITNLREEWDSGYLAAFLASTLGQLQIQRSISVTSVRPNTTKPGVEEIQVPRIQSALQQTIGNLLRIGIEKKALASDLTITAKLLVEALIEGKVTESALKDAQESLSQSDTGPDREILQRLTRNGIDVPNELPLFPNLDDLYTALDETASELVTMEACG